MATPVGTSNYGTWPAQNYRDDDISKMESREVRRGPSYPAERDWYQRVCPPNTIKTSKYTALSFVPLALLEQFRRFANAYFLFISILMIIGKFMKLSKPFTPFPVMNCHSEYRNVHHMVRLTAVPLEYAGGALRRGVGIRGEEWLRGPQEAHR